MKQHDKIRVAGVGCCLMDRIYGHVDFQSAAFAPYLSKKAGDGGLVPGALEFEEGFEKFTGRKFADLLPVITGGQPADKENIGGPCMVALINAAQLTHDISQVRFYGCHGDDAVGHSLVDALQKTPVDLTHYREEKGSETASTVVFSDPDYDEGHGERIFVNTIGASWRYRPDELDASFYDADVVVFGGTAITPVIHEALDTLLPKAQEAGCLTVVNTVFDSLNEKRAPGQRWPLGSSDDGYRHIDLLITDREEALHLSGQATLPEALAFFRQMKVTAVAVTNGSKDIYLYADGGRFAPVAPMTIPVSAAVTAELKKGHRGDTTGCGDNFAGGVMASLIRQMHEGVSAFDLREACRWGVVSGGFACFYYGGTFLESFPGEKLLLIQPYYDQYVKDEKDEG
jgi:sugar/nucleoside kinase (ribokinase family)